MQSELNEQKWTELNCTLVRLVRATPFNWYFSSVQLCRFVHALRYVTCIDNKEQQAYVLVVDADHRSLSLPETDATGKY